MNEGTLGARSRGVSDWMFSEVPVLDRVLAECCGLVELRQIAIGTVGMHHTG